MDRPLWNFSYTFMSCLYVDDGIFIELPNPIRQEESIILWGDTTVRLLGPKALNEDKKDVEGQWSTSHIILGLVYDTESMTVTLPEAKRAGARVLFGDILNHRYFTRLGVKVLQQIRGRMGHFKSTSAVWGLLTSPVDKLLTYADEIGERISCPKRELWGNFWWSIYAVEGFMNSDKLWQRLFTGNMTRLLTPPGTAIYEMRRGIFYLGIYRCNPRMDWRGVVAR